MPAVSQVVNTNASQIFVPTNATDVSNSGDLPEFRPLTGGNSVSDKIDQALQETKLKLGSDAAGTFQTTQGTFENLNTLSQIFSGQSGANEAQMLQNLAQISKASGQGETVASAAQEAQRLFDFVRNTSLEVYGTGNAFNYGKPTDVAFDEALGRLQKDGLLDQGEYKIFTAAYNAYKTVNSTMLAFQGVPGTGAVAADSLNKMLAQLLPQDTARGVTASISTLKTAFVTVQNVVNGAQGEQNAYVKAAVSLFTDPNIFGGDFAKTAGQIVAGYKLVQNVVNFSNNEIGAGQKALDAVSLLASTGVISQDLNKIIQGVGAGYKFTQNTINAFNGEAGAGVKALDAAQLLGRLGVLGPDVSKVIDTGVKVYTAVDSVISLIKSPSVATGFGAVGAVAGLIGGKTANTIANIATLGFGIATGGVGAIIGGVVGLLGGLFGGGKQFTKISDKLDATGDGKADTIKFESKNDDWYYFVNAGDLKISNVSWNLVENSNLSVDDEGRTYVARDNGDGGIYRDYGYRGESDPVSLSSLEVKTYQIRVNYNFDKINDATSLQMKGYGETIDITKEQYQALKAKLGGPEGTIATSDGRFAELRNLATPSGQLKIKQEKKNEGMTWYEDKNGDGVLDRLTQFTKIKGQTDGDDSVLVQYRNAAGEAWMSMAVDKNGNATDTGRAADKLRTLTTGEWKDLGSSRIYGSIDWSKKQLSADEQLSTYKYVASNTDLIQAFGTNVQAGYNHMMTLGASENRQVSFDAQAYMNANSDLKAAFGTDLLAASRHYIEHGFKENRALGMVSQDVDQDGRAETVTLFRDYIDIGFKQEGAPDRTRRVTKEGQLIFERGDFNKDGIVEEATRAGDGSITIRNMDGSGVTRITDAAGTLKELRGDVNGDTFADVLRMNASGQWEATLGGANGTTLPTATGATMEDALRMANLATPSVQLSVLEFIASNPDLIKTVGTDVAKGFEAMKTTQGASATFSSKDYLELNPDIARQVGNDPTKAVQYYISEGYKDGNRFIRKVQQDVNGDKVADTVYLAPNGAAIELRGADGAVQRTVKGSTLEQAVAQANIIGLLTWIAADDARIQQFGVDIVGAQRSIASDKPVGNPNASFNLFEFVGKEADRVQYYQGDLISILASYIVERQALLQSSLKR